MPRVNRHVKKHGIPERQKCQGRNVGRHEIAASPRVAVTATPFSMNHRQNSVAVEAPTPFFKVKGTRRSSRFW